MKVKLYSYADLMQERKKTVKDTVAFMMHLIIWCLHDEFNFGHNRLAKTLNWLETHTSKYMKDDGEVSLTDVHNMLIQECGINISFDKERMK